MLGCTEPPGPGALEAGLEGTLRWSRGLGIIRRAKLSGSGRTELEDPKGPVLLPRAWCLVIGKVQLCRRRRSKLGTFRGEAGGWKGSPTVADGIHPFVVETDKTPPHQIRSTPPPSISGFQR